MSNETPTRAVDFWFDPSCPWAWMTSRWVGEVAPQRDLDVRWHIMSLAVLNEDRDDLDAHYREFLPRAKKYALLVAAVAQEEGQAAVKPLYDALGGRIHLGARTDADAVIAESLAELGLPADLAERAQSGAYEQALRASHAEGIGLVGQDVGTPIIRVNGHAFFGPVVSPAPTGQDALDLWDGIVLASSYEGFFELKRSRTVGPIFEA